MDITKFFAGKIVLLTGATGFVGKVLLEKILRTCPSVKTIYLMVRPKKDGESIEKRVMEGIFSSQLFNVLFE